MIKGIDRYWSNVQRRSFDRSYLQGIGVLSFSSGLVHPDSLDRMDFSMVDHPACRWVEFGFVREVGTGKVMGFDDYVFRDVYVFGLHKLRRYYGSFGSDGNEQPGSRSWIIEFLN